MPSYTDTTFDENTQSWYKVIAVDAQGNRSADSSVVSAGGEPYDLTLGGTRSIPSIVSTIAFATEPTITSTVEVFNATQLSTQIASPNGKRIQIRGPGNGGSANYAVTVNFNNNTYQDIWLDMDNDANISNTMLLGNSSDPTNRPQRIKITGGSISTGGDYAMGSFFGIHCDDLIVDNVHLEARIAIMVGERLTRFSLLNSTLQGGKGFALMQVVGYGYSNGFDIQDFIIANTRFVSGDHIATDSGGPWRAWGGHNRFAMVDSYVDRHGAQSMMRYGGDHSNFWLENNAFENTVQPWNKFAQLRFDPSAGSPPPSPSPTSPLGPGRILNNKVWWRPHDISTNSGPQPNNVWSIGGSGDGRDYLDDITFSGNRVFAVDQTGYNGVAADANTSAVNPLVTKSDNLVYSSETGNYEAPPTATDYGADH